MAESPPSRACFCRRDRPCHDWGKRWAGSVYTTTRLADGFDYPVGKPNGDGYYIFRGFSPNGHLGEDWNGNGGGDTDEGDPVYSIAHGVVVFSEDYKRGWGNVVIIRHAYRENNGQIAFIDSLYGHLKVRSVKLGQQVTRGRSSGRSDAGLTGCMPLTCISRSARICASECTGRCIPDLPDLPRPQAIHRRAAHAALRRPARPRADQHLSQEQSEPGHHR